MRPRRTTGPAEAHASLARGSAAARAGPAAPRRFELSRSVEDTFRGVDPASNAEAMAEDGLVVVELHLQTGQAQGLAELA